MWLGMRCFAAPGSSRSWCRHSLLVPPTTSLFHEPPFFLGGRNLDAPRPYFSTFFANSWAAGQQVDRAVSQLYDKMAQGTVLVVVFQGALTPMVELMAKRTKSKWDASAKEKMDYVAGRKRDHSQSESSCDCRRRCCFWLCAASASRGNFRRCLLAGEGVRVLSPRAHYGAL